MSRIALVTGGTRGIGAAISSRLQKAGFSTAAVYHKDDAQAAAFSHATDIPTLKWDVSDLSACVNGVVRVMELMGGPVSILINNAGITRDVALHKMAEMQWHQVIGTNLDSCFNMCRATISQMREQGYGRIVNITSINGQKGQFGQTNYAAAKAGIIGFTKALALEGASKGITVNAVAPGYTDTDMVKAVSPAILNKIIELIPAGRLARPEEIAAAVAYLVSDDAAFITGTTISVNGGQYMA